MHRTIYIYCTTLWSTRHVFVCTYYINIYIIALYIPTISWHVVFFVWQWESHPRHVVFYQLARGTRGIPQTLDPTVGSEDKRHEPNVWGNPINQIKRIIYIYTLYIYIHYIYIMHHITIRKHVHALMYTDVILVFNTFTAFTHSNLP